jgi:hypothetical protein
LPAILRSAKPIWGLLDARIQRSLALSALKWSPARHEGS